MKAIGAMFGSFLGAFISDKFITNADLVIFVMSAIGGIACIAVPWSNNLYLMGFIFSLTGLSHGTLNVGKIKLYALIIHVTCLLA